MWRHYIYIHFRESDSVPFYVGKGTIHKRTKDKFARACEPHNNYHWQNTVNKHGIVIHLVLSCKTDKEAQLQEIKLIKEIGRYDLGTGPLVNKTNGGDGICGLVISDELRKKRSLAAQGPRSQEWINSVRLARKNGGNGGVVKHGDKLPETWVANLAAAKVGNKNPMYGKTGGLHHNARKVIDVKSGKIYSAIGIAADAVGLKMKTLYNMLSGHRPNKTTLRFEDGLHI